MTAKYHWKVLSTKILKPNIFYKWIRGEFYAKSMPFLPPKKLSLPRLRMIYHIPVLSLHPSFSTAMVASSFWVERTAGPHPTWNYSWDVSQNVLCVSFKLGFILVSIISALVNCSIRGAFNILDALDGKMYKTTLP